MPDALPAHPPAAQQGVPFLGASQLVLCSPVSWPLRGPQFCCDPLDTQGVQAQKGAEVNQEGLSTGFLKRSCPVSSALRGCEKGDPWQEGS